MLASQAEEIRSILWLFSVLTITKNAFLSLYFLVSTFMFAFSFYRVACLNFSRFFPLLFQFWSIFLFVSYYRFFFFVSFSLKFYPGCCMLSPILFFHFSSISCLHFFFYHVFLSLISCLHFFVPCVPCYYFFLPCVSCLHFSVRCISFLIFFLSHVYFLHFFCIKCSLLSFLSYHVFLVFSSFYRVFFCSFFLLYVSSPHFFLP